MVYKGEHPATFLCDSKRLPPSLQSCYDPPTAGPVPVFAQIDPLPGAQGKVSVVHGNGQ